MNFGGYAGFVNFRCGCGKVCFRESAKHPDKTFIGRIARGFDFLGYHFLDGALGAAQKTTRKMYETAVRLYEQKGHRNKPTPPVLKLRCSTSHVGTHGSKVVFAA